MSPLEPRARGPRARARVSPLFALSLLVALVGFVFVFRKAFAQEPPPGPERTRVSVKMAPVASAVPAPDGPVAPAASAALLAPAVSAFDDAGAYAEPIDFAELVDGGVPIHTEGRFRSPFANPRYGEPARVKVGLLLANVRDYDIQKGTFEADFFFTLTSDKPMPPMEPVFPNGKVDVKEVMADKPTFKMYRFVGSFSSPPDLREYPFDTQELILEIEDDDNGTDQVRLRPDQEHTNLDVGFNVSGWETSYIEARILNHYFPDRFEHDDMYYSRYVFKLGIRRFGMSAVFTVFVPAIVIVLISMAGLWFPRESLDVRLNATTPMLAAAVLFHFALMQALPATAYLTRADKLMMSVYAALFLHMLLPWLWFVFDEKHTDRIMRFGKWVGFPITLVLLAGGILA